MTATPLLDWKPTPMDRGGSTYDRDRDFERLNDQQQKVWNVVRDGEWHTLSSIAEKRTAPRRACRPVSGIYASSAAPWTASTSAVGSGDTG